MCFGCFASKTCICAPKEPSIFDYEPLWYWTALCSLTEATSLCQRLVQHAKSQKAALWQEQLSPKPKIGSLKPVTALQHLVSSLGSPFHPSPRPSRHTSSHFFRY